jgi:hypothetical protein
MRNAYLVGKSEGKRPFEKARRIWKDNIEMDLEDTGNFYAGV